MMAGKLPSSLPSLIPCGSIKTSILSLATLTLISITYISFKSLHFPLQNTSSVSDFSSSPPIFQVAATTTKKPDLEELSDIYHSSEVFRLNYAEMEENFNFKVYIYPDGDPNTFYQTPRKLIGKYANEGYFFQNIHRPKIQILLTSSSSPFPVTKCVESVRCTDSWRRVESFPREIYIPEHKFGTTPPGGTLLKESLHWFIRAFKVIVSFDMGNEEFGRVSTPEFGDSVVNKAFLGVSNGCLCLFGKSKSNVIKVWVMNKYGVQESWTHRFSVMDPDHEDFWLCPKNVLKKGPPFTYFFNTPRKHVIFLQNGEVLVVGDSRKLASYDPRNGSGRVLEFHGIEDWDQTVGYVESLVGFNSD